MSNIIHVGKILKDLTERLNKINFGENNMDKIIIDSCNDLFLKLY